MASTSKINYGLTPGEVMDTPIDNTTSIGWKQWEGAIKKLSDKLYNGSLDKMQMFIKKLKYRATATGWSLKCEINGKCISMNMKKKQLTNASAMPRNTTFLNPVAN